MSSRILLRSPSLSTNRRKSSSRNATSRARSKWALVALRTAWVLVVLYGEHISFVLSVKRCSYPSLNAEQHRLLLIADPQLPDHRSYPSRSWFLRFLTEKVIENYARKSYDVVLHQHNPQTIVFLGDLLDSGVLATDRLEHAHYAQRFKSIFPTHSIPTVYVPGNHDLGLRLPEKESLHARDQFLDAFGPLNGVFYTGNHTFVYVDSMALLEEHSAQSTHESPLNSTWSFVQDLVTEPDSRPLVLLSHIPLYRPEGLGANYQNLLDQRTSNMLLDYTQPVFVFSGDDHDYCEVKHPVASPKSWSSFVPEITIRAFSMVMGVRKPGYQLVSLYNPLDAALDPSQATVATQSCLLPDQLGIYLDLYVPFLALTLFLVALPRLWCQCIARPTHPPASHPRTHAKAPTKTYPRVYNHARALSRQSLYSDSGSSSDDEMYGYDQSSDVGFSYHTDEDGLPTPVTAASYLERKNKAVRRVSRVHLWDGRKRGDDPRATGARVCRPVQRVVQRVWQVVWMPWLGHLLSKSGLDVFLWSTVATLWQVVWPALVAAAFVWLWFIL